MSSHGYLDGYVDVSTRLIYALERWPELRVQADTPKVVTVDGHHFIEVTVTVWRSPDDPLPSRASAWEPFPGRTPYTRDSEMMNAETSALGRALAFMKAYAKIASTDEVRNRATDEVRPMAAAEDDSRRTASSAAPITSKQADTIVRMVIERGLPTPDLAGMSAADASAEIDRLRTVPRLK